MLPDPLSTAQFLLQSGRVPEARDVLSRAIASGQGGAPVHSLLGLVLHQLGDLQGCHRELRQAVRLAPQDGAAQFALASIAAALGEEEEAEAAARRAIKLGMDDIHSYVLLGRLFNKQGRFEEAEIAWRKAVRKNPAHAQAQRELAQLVWMLTGDLAKARAELDAAPQSHDIVAVTVRLLQDAGDEAGAWALVCKAADLDPSLNVLAARTGLKFDPQDSDRRLAAAAPGITPQARAKAEIEVDLALGRIEQAVRRAEALHAALPSDQHATALLAMAWRLAGDARYTALYDYDRLVKSYRITPPQGWNSLDDYLRDLGEALDMIHGPLTHPVGQSLRHGSQTMRSLQDYPDPAIRALFATIDAPIRAHIAAIGEGAQDYDFGGAWSVRLNSGGFHINHIHPEGWLSSAFYVRVPEKMESQQGWLKFGEPGPPTSPPLAPDHLVKPEPGLMVLFPSNMWHGTAPFTADDKRLSCAFDIVRRQP